MGRNHLSNLIRIAFLVVFGAISIFSQTKPSETLTTVSAPPPGNMSLLEGYGWAAGRSKDAQIGRITNQNGFLIFFDRSAVRGFYSRYFLERNDLLWLKSQTVNGQSMDVALIKSGEIVGLFDKTTRFSAKPNSTPYLVDFLLTVMTYGSGENTGQDIPAKSAPGNIKLLPGYVHQALQGIDSRPGNIKKADGLSLDYDLGRMAGNRAHQYFPEHFARLRKQTHLNRDAIETQVRVLQDKVDFTRRQKINGDDLMLVLLKDATLIASFPNSNANFIAKADTNEKIADFLLMVLTYQPSLDKRD